MERHEKAIAFFKNSLDDVTTIYDEEAQCQSCGSLSGHFRATEEEIKNLIGKNLFLILK